MSMRSYRPMRLSAVKDEQMRRELQPVDDWLRQLSANQARLVQMPIGTPTSVTNPTTAFNTGVFLYLPGRSFEQKSYGPVSFDAIGLGYAASTPTAETTVSFRGTTSDGSAQPARVFVGVQGSRSGATAAPQKRLWVFPSFTEINGGPQQGVHYFVDQDDFQTLGNKMLSNTTVYALEDTTRPYGWTNAAYTKMLSHAWGGSYPTGGFASTATRTTATGVIPSLQFPALDYKDNGVGQLDRTHCLAVVKRAHTFSSSSGSPFEPGGPLFGSSSGRELYPMFTTAQGGLSAPSDGALPIWRPVLSKSCDFVTSSTTVTIASGTTGIYPGMRMRETINAYTLTEDTHVVSVDSGTTITMSTTWPGSNATRTVEFFGMTWSTSTGAVVSIGDVLDSTFRVVDDGDTTKKMAFQVSGVTTGTTRTYTAPDYEGTLILSQGSATGGQTIGTSSHSSGTANDLAIEGRLLLGAATSYTSNRILHAISSGNTTSNLIPILFSGSLGSVSTLSGAYRLVQYAITGTPTATTGSAIISAALNVVSIGVPTGTSYSFVGGGDFQLTMGVTNGSVTTAAGQRLIILGPSSGSGNIAAFSGQTIEMHPRAGVLSGTVSGIWLTEETGNSYSGTTDTFTGIDFESANRIFDSSTVTNWIGLRIPAIANPTGTKLGVYSLLPSTMNGLRLDANSLVATHWLEIAAGTTTRAPIQLTSGTSLTSPVAGAIEFTTDDFFATISTGPARKAFVLDDGARLTAGRVPFATTNGRLTDDADLTFATDTLTVTKIAATQFTGDVQFTGSGVGWPYGSCYGNEIAWTQAVATTATWYLVSDTDMTDGELNNVTHDGSGKLTVSIAGRYLVNYGVDVSVDAANTHVVSGIAVNGTAVNAGQQHFHNMANNVESTLSSTAILSLAANDTVEVAVKHEAGGNQALSVDHLNLSIVQVGG